MMKKTVPAANPDAYFAGLSGWPRVTVEKLRAGVLASAALVEGIKWGHESDDIDAAVVRRLAREAVKLNKTIGDPTDV